MADTALSPATLLARAAQLYDAPGSPLAPAARRAARSGFASGAAWMALALEALRGGPLLSPSPAPNFQFLGLAKYGLAGGLAFVWALAAVWLDLALLGLFAVPLFYVIEAQFVFLFPLALDGHTRPFRAARRWTARAGGTVRVMAVVMPIAATMLGGGLVGRGFVRSWCLGCLAVCVWYERVRLAGAREGPVS